MVLTANGCDGPRAYAGLVSSFYETTKLNYQRLDDPSWAGELGATTPPDDVAWLNDVLFRP